MEIDPPKQDPILLPSQQAPAHEKSLPPTQAGTAPAGSGQQQTENSTLLEMLKQQTLLIQSLQATIAGLQDELKRMREGSSSDDPQL